MTTKRSNFLRRHYPDQVQGDPKRRFASISAEDAPQRPCFYVRLTVYTLAGVCQARMQKRGNRVVFFLSASLYIIRYRRWKTEKNAGADGATRDGGALCKNHQMAEKMEENGLLLVEVCCKRVKKLLKIYRKNLLFWRVPHLRRRSHSCYDSIHSVIASVFLSEMVR